VESTLGSQPGWFPLIMMSNLEDGKICERQLLSKTGMPPTANDARQGLSLERERGARE
jgi:hypothetical protein